jgi:ribonuclease HI
MDDIALLSTDGSAITEAARVIETFCTAVGASLNPGKCFIVSPSPLPSPLPLWEHAIYKCETEYLGFLLSHLDDDMANWERRLPQIHRACLRIKESPPASLNIRIMLTNIFVLSHIPYLARFTIIPLPLRGKLSKLLRKTLGSRIILPNHALFSNLGPFSLNKGLLHPYFLNIGCLAGKRPPLLPLPAHLPVSPNMVEYKRRWAINIYYQALGVTKNFSNADPHFLNLQDYLNWRDTISRPSHWIYLILLSKLPPPCPQHFPKPHAHSLAFLSINLHKSLPKGPRQNFLLYLYRAWGHRALMCHIVPGLSDRCRFNCNARETHEHFLDCPIILDIIKELHSIFSHHPVSNKHHKLSWPSSKHDLLCLTGFLSQGNIALRLYIISAIRSSIIIKGLSMAAGAYTPATQSFTLALPKLLHICRPLKPPPGNPHSQLVVPSTLPPPNTPHQAILNFDGGYDLAHSKGGAGSSLCINGSEVAAKSETIPFGSINSAEYRALVNGKILAIERGIRQLHIRGDSQLTLDLEKGEVSCSSPEVLLIYSQSMQLNHLFDSITYEKVERDQNKRADQLAHAAAISDSLGQYYVLNPSDPSRPKGTSLFPSITQIRDSQIFKLLLTPISPSQFLFPKRACLRPILSSEHALLPTRPTDDSFFRTSPFLSRPKRPRTIPPQHPTNTSLPPPAPTPPLTSPSPSLSTLPEPLLFTASHPFSPSSPPIVPPPSPLLSSFPPAAQQLSPDPFILPNRRRRRRPTPPILPPSLPFTKSFSILPIDPLPPPFDPPSLSETPFPTTLPPPQIMPSLPHPPHPPISSQSCSPLCPQNYAAPHRPLPNPTPPTRLSPSCYPSFHPSPPLSNPSHPNPATNPTLRTRPSVPSCPLSPPRPQLNLLPDPPSPYPSPPSRSPSPLEARSFPHKYNTRKRPRSPSSQSPSPITQRRPPPPPPLPFDPP